MHAWQKPIDLLMRLFRVFSVEFQHEALQPNIARSEVLWTYMVKTKEGIALSLFLRVQREEQNIDKGHIFCVNYISNTSRITMLSISSNGCT